jgi:hypothetical protein
VVSNRLVEYGDVLHADRTSLESNAFVERRGLTYEKMSSEKRTRKEYARIAYLKKVISVSSPGV